MATAPTRTDEPRGANTPALVVGLGVSRASIRPLRSLLAAADPDGPMCFVLVGRPGAELPAQLASDAALPVVEGAPGTPLAPGRVFVSPPGARIVAGDAGPRLGGHGAGDPPERPIDHLFASIAEAMGPRGAGILLAGTSADGAGGLSRIKAAGGLTIVQDPASGATAEVPPAAIPAGAAELVLRAEEMIEPLSRFAHIPVALAEPADAEEQARRSLPDDLVHRLSAVFRTRGGIDLRRYKAPTIARRLMRRMGLRGFDDVAAYLAYLREQREEQRALERDLLIGVTEFFRDPDTFDALGDRVIAPIVREAPPGSTVRAWVPACATGEEAYSVAMLLLEAVESVPDRDLHVQVFATDVNEQAVEAARRGVYPGSIADQVSADRLQTFFTRQDGGAYRVHTRLRDAVSFALHDLCADPPFYRMDLVSCRNLLIYLRPEAQEQVLSFLHFALKPSGFLFLGTSESVGAAQELFSTVEKAHRIYRRSGSSRPMPTRMSTIPRYRLPDSEPSEAPRPRPRERGEPDDVERARADLLQHLPPSVVVSAEGHVVYSTGDLGPYLRLPPGAPRLELLRMVREELATRVRGALYKCRRSDAPVSVLAGDGPDEAVRITASPARHVGKGAVVVTFEEVRGLPPDDRPPVDSRDHLAVIEQLERELTATREDLHHTVEELEASNEELRASNEESMSMNEELQAANEELEATTEELRSLNEELTTVNAELKEKVEQLEQAHDDLSNFFSSTQLATLFLDPDLRIRRFTPAAKELLDIGEADEGRRIGDIARSCSRTSPRTPARSSRPSSRVRGSCGPESAG